MASRRPVIGWTLIAIGAVAAGAAPSGQLAYWAAAGILLALIGAWMLPRR